MSQWFVETSRQVEGPFSTELVKSRLLAGHFSHEDLIWGRSLDEWRPLSWWIQALPELAKEEVDAGSPEVWHYAVDNAKYGPLMWPDLISNLKGMRTTSMDDLMKIMVWTKGMKDWAAVLEFHEVLDAIGVNKRETPRADIGGRVVIRAATNTYVSSLKTISEGGFGCEPFPGVAAGETVMVEIHSDAFKDPVHAKAQVRYSTERLMGFKFSQVNVESRAHIVQFVRKASGAQRFFIRSA